MPELTNQIPSAPWRLHGQAICFLASPFVVRLLVHYEDSPVGAYEEYALATLTKRGPHVFQMSVDNEASLLGGRTLWGFPKTLEQLSWRNGKNRVEFWRGSQIFCCRAFGPRFSFRTKFWTAQNRDGEWLRVPGQIKAQARFGWRGRQLALCLEHFEMVIEKPQ